jgi:hypothetical protein
MIIHEVKKVVVGVYEFTVWNQYKKADWDKIRTELKHFKNIISVNKLYILSQKKNGYLSKPKSKK